MRRIYPLFGVILLTCGVVLGLASWRSGADLLRPGGADRFLRFSGPLLRLENPSASGVGSPDSGVQMPMGGVPILVRFQGEGRVLPDTFRCLLNGEDVTHLLTVGVNGVAGTIYPLREGQNRLRVEVFGKTLWSGQYLQDSFELPIQARPLTLDLA
jgi:hypothetical protein